MALQRYRSTTVDELDNPVKTSSGKLWGFNIINRHTADIYVKFYDKASNAINAASDVPLLTLMVPSSGSIFQEPNYPRFAICEFNTAISVRAVTGVADTDTTAPGTLPIVELQYD